MTPAIIPTIVALLALVALGSLAAVRALVAPTQNAVTVASQADAVAICPLCKREYSEAEFQAHPTWRVGLDFPGDPEAVKVERIDCLCIPADGEKRLARGATLSIEHIEACSSCNDGGWVWGRAENGDPIHAPCRCLQTHV